MFAPTYCRTPGAGKKVVVTFSPYQMVPLSVPSELDGLVSKEVWSYRIPRIIETASLYSKPRLELLWSVVGLMATLILPVAFHQLIFINMGRGTNEYYSRQAEVRAIEFGIFVALAFFFLLPLGIWKFIGDRRMKLMLRRWGDADRINHGHSDVVPTWKVKCPKILREKTTLVITIPHTLATSTFHPNAYVPSYMNGPADAGADYFYPYKPGPGLPRMSTIGSIPLFMDEKPGFNNTKV